MDHNAGEGTHPKAPPKMPGDPSLSKRLAPWDISDREVHLLTEDYFEVLVIVEGVEPFTSSTVQARHSYSFGQDLVLNGDFMPCTFLKSDGSAMVDFGKFHQIVQTELVSSGREVSVDRKLS